MNFTDLWKFTKNVGFKTKFESFLGSCMMKGWIESRTSGGEVNVLVETRWVPTFNFKISIIIFYPSLTNGEQCYLRYIFCVEFLVLRNFWHKYSQPAMSFFILSYGALKCTKQLCVFLTAKHKTQLLFYMFKECGYFG